MAMTANISTSGLASMQTLLTTAGGGGGVITPPQLTATVGALTERMSERARVQSGDLVATGALVRLDGMPLKATPKPSGAVRTSLSEPAPNQVPLSEQIKQLKLTGFEYGY
jgi:hypothetical protein